MPPTSETSAAAIIKADRIGRQRYSAQFKNELLATFEQSSMSGQAFAAHHGVKYPTFASWVTQRRKERSAPKPTDSTPSFVLAEFQAPRALGVGLPIELTAQATVTMTSIEQAPLLAALIKALA